MTEPPKCCLEDEMFRWALWQNESDNAPLWDSLQARSMLPRDVEGTKAFWLLLRLPGNINSMHPFQELGSLFRLAKQKKEKCLLSLPARGRCRTVIARLGQVLERRGQTRSVVKETAWTVAHASQPQTRQGVHLPCFWLIPACSAKCFTFSKHSEMLGKWMEDRKDKEGNHYLVRSALRILSELVA